MSRDRISITTDVALSELAVTLSRHASNEALVKFVKDLDAMTADWGFTKKLHDHFAKEMKKFGKEVERDGKK